MTNLSSALPMLSCATAWGVLSRARDVRWITTIWYLLFMASVLSTTHFPDGQAADDALEAIEAVVNDVPDEALPAAKPSKGLERIIKVALGKTVKQPGQCFSVEHWVAHASDVPDAPSTSAATPDHPSDTPEFWLPPPPMVLMPGLRIVCVRVALPPLQIDPMPAPMLRPPVHARSPVLTGNHPLELLVLRRLAR